MGFFDKIKKISIFNLNLGSELTDDFYDELEESLILADAGMDTALEIVEELKRRVRSEKIKTAAWSQSPRYPYYKPYNNSNPPYLHSNPAVHRPRQYSPDP